MTSRLTSAWPPPQPVHRGRATERVALGQPSRIVDECATLLPVAAVLFTVFELATGHGTGGTPLLASVMAVVALQVVPGAVVWRAARPSHGWWAEDLVVGFAIGASLGVPAHVVAVAWSLPSLEWLVPLTVVGGLLAVPTARRRVVNARCHRLPRWWGTAVASTTLVPAMLAVRFYDEPLRWTGWARPYVDLPYHLALAGQVAYQWPLHYPQVSGEPLHYQWFSYAWMDQVSATSGTSPDVILLRFMPAVIAVAVPLVTAVAAMRITRLVWTGPVAAAISCAMGELDLARAFTISLPFTPFSPTQGFGLLLFVPLLAMLVMAWRRELPAVTAMPLLLFLSVLAGGSKGSTLPVLVVGCAVATLAAFVLRSPLRWRVAADTGLVVVVLVGLMKLLFGNSEGGLHIAPMSWLADQRGAVLTGRTGVGATTLLVIALLTVLTLCARMVGVVACLAETELRAELACWLLLGCGLAGLGALVVFAHPGQSQLYFWWTATIPLGILASWGLVWRSTGTGQDRLTITIGALVGVLAALTAQRLVGSGHGSGLRSAATQTVAFAVLVIGGCAGAIALPARLRLSTSSAVTAALVAVSLAGVVPALEYAVASPSDHIRAGPRQVGAISAGEVQAARWLRDHARTSDIVMTNRHCRGRESVGCDHRTFFVAAYSERQVLVEGWAYTQRANALGSGTPTYAPRNGPFWRPGLLTLNDGFFTEPTPSAARELYARGVRWVYVDWAGPHSADLSPYAVLRSATPTARVYELLPPGGTQSPDRLSGQARPG